MAGSPKLLQYILGQKNVGRHTKNKRIIYEGLEFRYGGREGHTMWPKPNHTTQKTRVMYTKTYILKAILHLNATARQTAT